MLAKAADVSFPFKLSNDPKFAEKLKDIVGLYVQQPCLVRQNHPLDSQWLRHGRDHATIWQSQIGRWRNTRSSSRSMKKAKPLLRRVAVADYASS
jgi:hypothetical protein